MNTFSFWVDAQNYPSMWVNLSGVQMNFAQIEKLNFGFFIKKRNILFQTMYLFNAYVTYIVLRVFPTFSRSAQAKQSHIDTTIIHPSQIHHKSGRYYLWKSDQYHPDHHHHHICLFHHIPIFLFYYLKI